MTQPTGKPQVVDLPPMQHPICNRVLAHPPYPATDSKQDGQPTLWEQGKPHPLIAGLVVLRMYVVPGVGVDVYSVAQPPDGKQAAAVTGGVRNTLPWSTLRLTEELMDVPTLVDEIAAAESDNAGGEEPEPPGLARPGAVSAVEPPPAPNGAS